MNSQIKQKDLEALSAYLDNQLTEKERASLEARLQSDEALRVSLSEMQTTRQILRKTPALRAPRNFMLTPEMAGVKTKKTSLGLFNSFRLAFVMTGFLFALIVVGDLGNFLPSNLLIAQSPVIEFAADVSDETAANDTAAEAETLALSQPGDDSIGESDFAESEAADSSLEESALLDEAVAEEPSMDEIASDQGGDSLSDDPVSMSTMDGSDDSQTTAEDSASIVRITATSETTIESVDGVADESISQDEHAEIEGTETVAEMAPLEGANPELFQPNDETEERNLTEQEEKSPSEDTTVTTISTSRIITWLIEAFLAGLLVFLGIGVFVLWRRR